MSQFKIQHLLEEGMLAAPTDYPTFRSLAAAFRHIEQDIEVSGRGEITATFAKGDVLTVFAEADGYDIAFQIVPVAEVPR
jgi:hypothetical protein